MLALFISLAGRSRSQLDRHNGPFGRRQRRSIYHLGMAIYGPELAVKDRPCSRSETDPINVETQELLSADVEWRE
jgi:hypothetical protein